MSITTSCANCGADITEIVVTTRHYAKDRIPERCYCNRACRREAELRAGHFAAMGAAGNESQHAVKEATGHAPGYDKRREAVIASNKEKPRRAKKGQSK